MSISGKFSKLFYGADRKRREFAVDALNFTEEHKQSLVMIADPDTDVIIFAYRGAVVPLHYLKDGKKCNIVANALNYRRHEKQGSKDIDQFLLAVDSALYNIAKKLYDDGKKGIRGKVLGWVHGKGSANETLESEHGVRSPIQLMKSVDDSHFS